MRHALVLCVLLWASSAHAATLCVGDGSGGDDTTAKGSLNYIAGNEAGSTCYENLIIATWGNANRFTDADGDTTKAAAAGDTVYVFGGTYDFAGTCTGSGLVCRYEGVYSPVAEGTASDNLITIICVGTCTLTSDTANSPSIGAFESDYVKWYADRNAGHSWTIVACGEDPTNGATDECTDGSQWAAIPDTGPILLGSATGVWVEGVIISSIQTVWTDNWEAIRFNFCTNCVARNNSVSDFQNLIGSLNGTCFTVYHSSNFLVEHNECSGSASGWIVKNNGVGIASGTFRFNKVTDTTINCFVWSIDDPDFEEDVYIYQNTCDSPGLIGIESRAQPGALNCRIVNNTFYNMAAALNLGSYDGCLVYNNIFHTAARMVYSDTTSMPASTALDFEHNVYYNTTTEFYEGTDGDEMDLTAFKAAYANQCTVTPLCVDTDPRLANAAAGDFRLCTAAMTPDASCAGESSVRATPLGVDILDLDGDSSTTDNIPPGAYITSGQTEEIGLAGAAAEESVPLNDKRIRVLRFAWLQYSPKENVQ